MTSPCQSRREALRQAALGAGAIAAAGMLRPGLALAQTTDEENLRDFLAEAIGLEQISALAYSIAAGAQGTDPELKRNLEQFRDQEQAHANALRSAIDEIGFDPPEPPDTPADTSVFEDVDGIDDEASTRLVDLLEGLSGLERSEQLLDYLVKLEGEQLDYYIGAGPGLDSEDLSTTSAEIVGCQAQHLFVLRRRLGDSPEDALVAAHEATDVGAK